MARFGADVDDTVIQLIVQKRNTDEMSDPIFFDSLQNFPRIESFDVIDSGAVCERRDEAARGLQGVMQREN